ncbi:MAG: CAP domain-containing protein [Epsilonproteobacteria bacterium]|nr:CAP domain-containing protein [Campylobacterota bacterium]
MRYFIVLILTLLINGCNSNGTQVLIDESYIPPTKTLSAQEKEEFLEAINRARADKHDCKEYGVLGPSKPIKWSEELYNAAYEHSFDMANSNTFSHNGSNTKYDKTAIDLKLNRGSKFNERIEHNGFKGKMVGENISAGKSLTSANDVVDAWLKSPAHCAILMDNNYNYGALAVAHKDSSKYLNYWTLDLGKK